MDEAGNASFLRSFILELLPESDPLNEIAMIIPAKNILNLSDFSDSCFDIDFAYNDVQTRAKYKIIKPLETDQIGQGKGTISDDGFEPITVFSGATLEKDSIFYNIASLTFGFPEPIQPGQLVECRTKFQINSIADNLSTNPSVLNYGIELPYFEKEGYERIVDLVKGKEIKVLSSFGGESTKYQGGFDVVIYVPYNFTVTKEFQGSFLPHNDRHDYDGSPIDVPKEKIIWRARDIAPDYKELGIGSGFCASIEINATEKLTLTDLRDDVDDKLASVAIEMQKHSREVRLGTTIAFIALIISILYPQISSLFNNVYNWLFK